MASLLHAALRGRRELVVIAAVCLAVIAIIWLLTLERIGYERDQAEKSAIRQNSNLALALEEQAFRTIKQAEQALLFMSYEYEEDERQVLTLSRLTANGVFDEKAFASLLVTDERGYVLLEDGKPGLTKVDDREFFSFHRDRPWNGTRVSPPVFGRMTGREVIPITRRINGPEGVFKGVYVVGLDPHYLLSAFEKFDIGRAGLIQLVSKDGYALARRAGNVAKFGEDMRSGSMLRHAAAAANGAFITTGQFDGVRRYVSYRTLADYRLVVAVGTSVDEALADFRKSEREHHLSALAATLVLLALAASLAVVTMRRNRAVDALASSEALYRATFEQAGVGVAHAEPSGRFLRVNRKLCQMLGYAESELLGLSWQDVTHPEDARLSLELVRGMMEQPGRSTPEIEKRYRRKDGSELLGLASLARVRRSDGEPDYFVTVLQDITDKRRAELALRESERRFNDMLGRVDLVSMMLDGEARVIYCNDYLLELTGWRREEVLGHNWFDLFIPAESPGLKEVFARLLHDLPDTTHHENEILTRDGKRRMIRWNNAVLRSTAGEVIGTASIGEDVTERNAAEAKLLEQLDELRRFQKATVDRELRMIELEAQIRTLKEKAVA